LGHGKPNLGQVKLRRVLADQTRSDRKVAAIGSCWVEFDNDSSGLGFASVGLEDSNASSYPRLVESGWLELIPNSTRFQFPRALPPHKCMLIVKQHDNDNTKKPCYQNYFKSSDVARATL
jgi:hypothetical protein